MYTPEPIDTSGVILPEGLLGLMERLAENTHEVWARQRIAEGWSYGPRRDDDAKTHPGLVPFVALSETEKEYDRLAALETLKVIVALGCRIEPPGAEGGR